MLLPNCRLCVSVFLVKCYPVPRGQSTPFFTRFSHLAFYLPIGLRSYRANAERREDREELCDLYFLLLNFLGESDCFALFTRRLRHVLANEFLKARIVPQRIEHRIDPEQRWSERHPCSQRTIARFRK